MANGLPPADAALFNTTGAASPPAGFANTYPMDMAAFSAARGLVQAGAGNGGYATGFVSFDTAPFVLVFLTGSGQTETWTIPAGGGASVVIRKIVSYGGTNLVVLW